jgi:hypothetical protein
MLEGLYKTICVVDKHQKFESLHDQIPYLIGESILLFIRCLRIKQSGFIITLRICIAVCVTQVANCHHIVS